MIGVLAMLAALQGSAYTEVFTPGQDVDLAQGYYICSAPLSKESLDRLARIRNPIIRHRKASTLGCPFYQKPLRTLARVVEVMGTVCGPLVPVRGGTMCQREAHQLIVQHHGSRQQKAVAIYMQDDYSID